MFRIAIGAIGLLSAGLLLAPAYADSPQTTPAPPSSGTPGKQAQSSVPPSGIIRPAPRTGDAKTITPPNVDPDMSIPPPGTPGGNPKVVPR